MKKSLLIIALAIVSISFGNCGNSSAKVEKQASAELAETAPSIQILYFHGDRRCPTCIKVGEISLALFNAKYANNTVVAYKEVNTDKDENKAIAEKYQIMSSSLVIDVNGVVKNITVDAFRFAKSDPAALEKIIADIIEEGLKK